MALARSATPNALQPALRDDEPVNLRDAVASDVVSIVRIFNELISTRTVTWSEQPDTVEDRMVWLGLQQDDRFPVLVAEVQGSVVGFASYGAFRDNRKWPGYRFTVELSIHVAESHWGMGTGRRLMMELVERARDAGMHAIVAAVDGENNGSIAFHKRMGFDEVGRMPQVGRKFDRWLDLVWMQRLL